MSAGIAAQVAAEVADATVARLIAAGWGPGGGAAPVPPHRILLEAPRALPPQQTVVRVVTEPQAGGWFGYNLPPGQAQAAAQPMVAPPPAPPAVSPEAHATATAGYAAIRAGDLKQGVGLLKAAEAMDPKAPQADTWRADVAQLTKRWSGGGYVLTREGAGGGDALAASPVLGGGQAGVALGYRLNPLGKQRVSIIGRLSVASAPQGGLDGETTEAALGLRWEPSRKIPVAIDVERRIALGTYSRNAWAGRISGGAQRETEVRGARLKLEGYAEGGVVEGFTRTPDLYVGAQARGGTPLLTLGDTRIDAGVGLWGGAQRNYGVAASRLDIGPSSRVWTGPWPFYAQIDWRQKVAGNALPGSGPVLTVAGEF
ncbi:hypothetical protein FJQ54_08810 [Sandaracinobacter neustonicus]|uniref:Uncharacterized protein n=2 Tax=Sandaracinobacter neustonicus TaxID=1715348 RepID=A0A501XL42_9SPHN|nr:hypothetical protein FJQ54_08810 [Sandaracinobacter neustonicus]